MPEPMSYLDFNFTYSSDRRMVAIACSVDRLADDETNVVNRLQQHPHRRDRRAHEATDFLGPPAVAVAGRAAARRGASPAGSLPP